MRAAALVATAVLGAATGAHAADRLAQCAAIAADDARLACYDRLAGHHAASPAASNAALPAGPAAAAPAKADAAPSAAGDPLADPKNFGLERRQVVPAAAEPVVEQVESRVAAVREDGQGHVQLVLDNGQTWVCTDADPRVRSGDAVQIRRATLGSYLLHAPSKLTCRAKRVR